MNTTEILEVVQQVTGFSLTELRHRHRHEPVIDARYLFVLLMVEEGYKHGQIADTLMLRLSVIRYSRLAADKLLRTDKRFKILYLKCIATIAEKEDLECA